PRPRDSAGSSTPRRASTSRRKRGSRWRRSAPAARTSGGGEGRGAGAGPWSSRPAPRGRAPAAPGPPPGGSRQHPLPTLPPDLAVEVAQGTLLEGLPMGEGGVEPLAIDLEDLPLRPGGGAVGCFEVGGQRREDPGDVIEVVLPAPALEAGEIGGGALCSL